MQAARNSQLSALDWAGGGRGELSGRKKMHGFWILQIGSCLRSTLWFGGKPLNLAELHPNRADLSCL